MKSAVIKRSVVLRGHKTSVSLEDAFWEELRRIAISRKLRLGRLIEQIDISRETSNLSSALRLFTLREIQKKAA